ncbi:A disintegrin and metalloproteinase with thrombospondin motifs 12, partial [Bulinus truncatus]
MGARQRLCKQTPGKELIEYLWLMVKSDHTSNNETTTVKKAVTNLNYFHDVIDSPSPAANQHNLQNSSLLDVSSNKSFTTQYDEIFEEKDKKWNSVVLTISSPDLFQTIHIVMTQVHELLSPGFVIQRVKGNISWLEEVKDHGMDCYFSGTVLEQQNKSTVALSLCDGVRGVIQMNGERYYIQPENQGQLPQNIFSKTSFTSVVSSYLKHYKHIITKSSIGYPHLSSHCSIT